MTDAPEMSKDLFKHTRVRDTPACRACLVRRMQNARQSFNQTKSGARVNPYMTATLIHTGQVEAGSSAT